MQGRERHGKLKRIFFSVGTHPLGFERLVKYFDELVAEGKLKAEVFGVIGTSAHIPRHFAWKKYVEEEEFIRELRKADIVVTQGGTGTILTAVLNRKPLIIVPRRKKFHEHTDDHQLDAAHKMKESRKARVAETKAELLRAVLHPPRAGSARKPVKIWSAIQNAMDTWQ